jgi:hypothetical protein
MPRLEGLADRRSGLLQGDAVLVQRLHLLADDGAQVVGLHEGAVGVGGRGEAAGDLDPLGAEGRDHLAQRGILAPHLGDVFAAQVLQPDQAGGRLDLSLLGHRSFSRGQMRSLHSRPLCGAAARARTLTRVKRRDGFSNRFQSKFSIEIAAIDRKIVS